MDNRVTFVTSLALFVMVLIGVTVIEPLAQEFFLVKTFQPLIVLTGFFVFLVAVALFAYGVINILKRR